MKSQDRARARRLEKFYKITINQWEEMHKFQGLLCAICGKPQKSGKRLATDHDHRTGLIRGLLCSNCNRILGRIERTWEKNTDIVRRVHLLADYLQNPPAVKALGRSIYTFPGRFGTKRHRKWMRENHIPN